MALSQAEILRTGTFVARSVYGGDYIDSGFRGALDGEDDPQNYDDDYRGYLDSQTTDWAVLTEARLGAGFFAGPDGGSFTSGGLYVTPSEDGNGGELLVIEATVEGEKTLVIAFRGSDGDDAAAEGQTFTKQGVANYYLLLRPAILAAAQYAQDQGITNVIVAGQSLGGAMVDVFALSDADLFSGTNLYLVSLASPGVVPDLPDLQTSLGLDLGNSVLDGNGRIVTLGLPDDVTAYYGVNHSEDRVYFSIPAMVPGLTPNFVLYRNRHFDDAITIDLPNIDNTDVDYSVAGLEVLFVHGFGGEHNVGLYWSNISALTGDPLFADYAAQNIIMGVNNYAMTPDYGTGPFPAFLAYTGGSGIRHDRDTRALNGTDNKDYILGLAGNDMLRGRDGRDLLSGGAGNDTLLGGNGHDKMHGGDGRDRLVGGSGNDTGLGGNGADTLLGKAGRDSLVGQAGRDLLKGGDGDDVLRGGDHDDRLDGNRHDDTLIGDDGADLLRGGGQNDLLKGGQGNDTLRGGAGADTLRGGGQGDQLEGGQGNDTLRGGAGADTLRGGGQGDQLEGGAGNDTLTGGGGADTFLFDGDTATGQDVITDFQNGTDVIRITGGVEFVDLSIVRTDGNTEITWSTGSVTLTGETGLIDGDDFLFS